MIETFRERRLTVPTSLTEANGHLNWDAAGWAAQPLVDTTGLGRGWGRNKRWEYWGVVTPSHLIGMTISHIDYAAVHEVWVLERSSERTWGTGATVIPPHGVEIPPVLEAGRARARARGLGIAIDETDGGTRLRAIGPGVRVDVVAELPPGHERLAVVVPWSDRRFQYTVKDVARPARGWVETDGARHEVSEGQSWAVLDHGRGRPKRCRTVGERLTGRGLALARRQQCLDRPPGPTSDGIGCVRPDSARSVGIVDPGVGVSGRRR